MKKFIPIGLLFCLFSSIINTLSAHTNKGSLTVTPTINSYSPVSGPIGTLLTITGSGLDNLSGFSIANTQVLVISNTGTVLTGLVMPGTATGVVSITTPGGTANSNGNFTVTNTPSPTSQPGTKLVANDNIGAAYQGFALSLSADGKTAIIGGYFDHGGTGAVWVYYRNGSSWQKGVKLIGFGSAGFGNQGNSISLSADGNTVLIGASLNNNGQGAGWVFVRVGNNWIEQAKLLGTSSLGTSYQGCAVSISADGNTAILGGYYDNNGQGAAWVFTRNNGVWTQQAKLTDPTDNSSAQGTSVAISADGNTIFLGGPNYNNNQGAVWVYSRNGNTWTLYTKIVPSDNSGRANFGFSVALTADGNMGIIGGNINNSYQGAAWIYNKIGGIWNEQTKLVAGDNLGGAKQGYSVGISADGKTAIAGGNTDNGGIGAAWIYSKNGNNWTSTKLVGAGNIGSSNQGNEVAISADGNVAMVGGPSDNTNQGATWSYLSTIALPITFEHINAICETKYVKVLWHVADPLDCRKYIVQRSLNGYQFKDIGIVNASALQDYIFQDMNPAAGTNYYRIKSINISEQVHYSDIVKVIFSTTPDKLHLFPNPVTDNHLKIEINGKLTGIYNIYIYNTAGIQFYHKSVDYNGSKEIFDIQPQQNLINGIYNLKLIAPDNSIEVKTFLVKGNHN